MAGMPPGSVYARHDLGKTVWSLHALDIVPSAATAAAVVAGVEAFVQAERDSVNLRMFAFQARPRPGSILQNSYVFSVCQGGGFCAGKA